MTCIITGASRGIGKALATIFAANGFDLFLTSQHDMALYKTVEELTTQYSSVTIRAKAFDLSQKEEAIACGNWIIEKNIIPGVLINNVGVFEPGGVTDEADGALEKQMATNLYSAYYLTRTLLPIMQQQKSGHIFNMCSIASLDAYKNGGGYSISKFALYGFSKNLRRELQAHNIKVTSVLPGSVYTDSWGDFNNSDNRIMIPEDVAAMVFACAQLSPQACVEELLIRPQLGDL